MLQATNESLILLHLCATGVSITSLKGSYSFITVEQGLPLHTRRLTLSNNLLHLFRASPNIPREGKLYGGTKDMSMPSTFH